MSARMDFSNLEYALQRLRNSVRVLDIVAEDTVYERGGVLVDYAHEKCGAALKGYVLLVLTEDQAEAIGYQIGEVERHVSEVERLYFSLAEAQP